MIAHITNEQYAEAAKLSDLDKGLAQLMAIADPGNEYDLGGHAGHWFSEAITYVAPQDNGSTQETAFVAWPYLDEQERANHLKAFFAVVVILHDPRWEEKLSQPAA